MNCLPFFHEWKVFAVYDYIDTSYGAKTPASMVAYRCTRCGILKSKILFACPPLEGLEL